LFVKILLPAVAGSVVSGVAMVALVTSQTAAPDNNPASQPAISYGAR
jgi:hypothetical protein